MEVTFINVPNNNFKIRTKQDAKTFADECIVEGKTYQFIVSEDKAYFIRKSNGAISVTIKQGNLRDVFNPELEIANSKSNCYDTTVEYMIYKIRKFINKKWFN